jgi:hypothetical protein
VGLLAVHIAYSASVWPRVSAGRYEAESPRESAGRHGASPNAAEGILLALTSISATVVVLLGLMLANVEADDSTALFRHRWLGIATAATSAVVGALFIRQRRAETATVRLASPYRVGLAVLGMLMGATGHYGGTITHGRGFLTAYAPFFGTRAQHIAASESADPAEPARLTRVLGVIDRHCLSCHNETKHRGGLRLDTWPREYAPGKSGHPVVVAGDPWKSEIVRRITLPEDEDDAMPPSGHDRVPAEDALAIIHWMQRGAGASSASAAGGEMGPPMPVGTDATVAAALSRDNLLARITDAGGTVRPKTNDAQRLVVDFTGVESVTDATLASLVGGADWIAELHLSGTRITNAGLEAVAKLTRLQALFLDQTSVTDDGIMWLADLPNLRRLSVRNSQVTDEGVNSLLLEQPELTIVPR